MCAQCFCPGKPIGHGELKVDHIGIPCLAHTKFPTPRREAGTWHKAQYTFENFKFPFN